MIEYQCVKCGGINCATSWNKATEYRWGEGIQKIQDVNFQQCEYCHPFVCPHCYEVCSVQKNHIKELQF